MAYEDDFHSSFDPDDHDDEDFFDQDPDFGISGELSEAERQIRIQRMRDKIEQLGGSWDLSDEEDLTPESEEALLNRVLFFENAPRTTWARMLISDGVELPHPSVLTSRETRRIIWEVIFGLARRRTFLYHTDHLSDRELYDRLWRETLNGDTFDLTYDPESACHIDLLGSGSEKDTLKWLRFHASDEDREQWRLLLQSDEMELPPKEKPPYDRDRFLPKRDDY